MCGRFAQHQSCLAYAREMGWDVDDFGRLAGARAASWNVPPGTRPWLMHRFGGERGHMDLVTWGYRPSWAIEKGIPVAINARVEKGAAAPFFRALWKSGRAIVPADGWYEWTGAKGRKQPWYIRLKSERPMFLAAITNYRPDQEPSEGTGFVIVTAAAEGGMVDVHDRRPVVFSAEDAGIWMDNGFPAQQAEQLARTQTLPAEEFAWYRVSTAVNRAGNDGEELIRPV